MLQLRESVTRSFKKYYFSFDVYYCNSKYNRGTFSQVDDEATILHDNRIEE